MSSGLRNRAVLGAAAFPEAWDHAAFVRDVLAALAQDGRDGFNGTGPL